MGTAGRLTVPLPGMQGVALALLTDRSAEGTWDLAHWAQVKLAELCSHPTPVTRGCVLPLGVLSEAFRAPWMTAWASEFFFFRKSMVSRKSSSSVSWEGSENTAFGWDGGT